MPQWKRWAYPGSVQQWVPQRLTAHGLSNLFFGAVKRDYPALPNPFWIRTTDVLPLVIAGEMISATFVISGNAFMVTTT